MRWSDLIFANDPNHRRLRYMLFWGTWFMYFCLYFFALQGNSGIQGVQPVFVTTGPFVIIKTGLLVLLYAVACYPFILKLVPVLLQGKYFRFITGTMIMFGLLTACCHLLYWYAFPFINDLMGDHVPARFRTRYWPAINLGLINGGKVIIAAATLTYLKHWWNKTMESERLLQEKAQTEIRSLRTQINPYFLINSLNTVHKYAVRGSEQASELLLKLADLLSYSLYECNSTHIPVWKEVDMMRYYIEIEKNRLGENFETELNMSDDVSAKNIAPLLLLPFIENGIRQSALQIDSAWMNIDLRMHGDDLLMTQAVGRYSPDKKDVVDTYTLNDIRRRLDILYPNFHELKFVVEEEMIITHLKIRLREFSESEIGKAQEFSLLKV